MTFRRAREDNSFASEAFPRYHHTGPALFCHPAEVENWNEAVLPLTPPDSALDSPFSDCQEMDADAWDQDSLPLHDQTFFPSSSLYEWHGQRIPVNPTGPSVLETTTWPSATSEGIDSGLSPVLSHKSQSSHTLPPYSEPDAGYFANGLDVSFVPHDWESALPMDYPDAFSTRPAKEDPYVYTGPVPSPDGSHLMPFTAPGPVPVPAGYHYEPVSNAYPGPQAGQGYPTAPMRPLLPRTTEESASVNPVPIQGRPQGLESQTPHQSYVASHPLGPSVSRPSYQSGPEAGLRAIAPAHVSRGPTDPYTPLHTDRSNVTSDARVAASFPITRIQPAYTLPGYIVEPSSASDFSAFLQFDGDGAEDFGESSLTDGLDPSVTDNYDWTLAVPSQVKGPRTTSAAIMDFEPAIPRVTNHSSAIKGEDGEQGHTSAHAHHQRGSARRMSVKNGDEGRRRSHPYYERKPGEDGQYHCPYFTDDGPCTHKPTKLKCNYDKYIDSHLRPFRCKFDKCTTLAFSSTACLLRHEREAHGLHGHGNKPNLCIVPECERAQDGHGFPRRYNLNDHMRRVHKIDVNDIATSSGVKSHGSTRERGAVAKKNIATAAAAAATPRGSGAATLEAGKVADLSSASSALVPASSTLKRRASKSTVRAAPQAQRLKIESNDARAVDIAALPAAASLVPSSRSIQAGMRSTHQQSLALANFAAPAPPPPATSAVAAPVHAQSQQQQLYRLLQPATNPQPHLQSHATHSTLAPAPASPNPTGVALARTVSASRSTGPRRAPGTVNAEIGPEAKHRDALGRRDDAGPRRAAGEKTRQA